MNDYIVKQLVPSLARRLQWWCDNFRFRISQAVGRLRAGKTTLAEYQQFGRDELKDTYYGIAETGKGAPLTAKERAEVRRTLKEQLAFWDRFCQAIADQQRELLDRGLEGGELEAAYNGLYDKYDRRAQSYAGAIEAEGQRWALAGMYKDGKWFQWRLSEAEHCETCIERDGTIAQMKDGRLPYYPKDGTTLCLYNCLCHWQPISKFRALALRALGKLKRVVRRKSFGEIVDEYLEKGGPGSGWFAPPRGTHDKEKEGEPAFAPGPEREARRRAGIYDVISETDEEGAKILLTQGIEPSFKPQIAGVTEFAPGKGLEREGLYVANEEAFSKGSFGRVRLYLTTNKDELKSPREMTQLGRMDIDDVLGTENGAVTSGALPKKVFSAVEVYKAGKWERMEPDKYLESIGVDPKAPKLPTVPKYRKWVEQNAETLYLRPDQVEAVIHDYNRASLEDKIWMAQEAGLI